MIQTEAPAFERRTVNGIRLHVLPTTRFKTFSISVYIGAPLDERTVTANALIPYVLRRGSATFPETKQFREQLDEMYGAGFGFDIYKRGDYQLLQFRMDVIHDRFVSSGQSLLAQSLQFLGDAITNPAMENGQFLSKYVDQEKATLTRKLQAIVNDKIRYAAERCIAEMCEGEPYRLHPLGRLEDIEALTVEQLVTRYKELLNEAPIDIYIAGDTTADEAARLVADSFSVQGRSGTREYKMLAATRNVSEVKRVTERMEVGQGKLNMGLRMSTNYRDDAYPAALLYNGVLGGYPHSKLFINVREKASLAYYASSRYDGHKGLLTIQSGIEIENYEKAVDIIQRQLDAMRGSNISELELNQTKAMIINQLREIQDAAHEMIMFDFNAVLSGRERTTAELIQAIESLQAADIKQVAEGVALDTIYFLRDREKEGEERAEA